jgi:hypothetical protein
VAPDGAAAEWRWRALSGPEQAAAFRVFDQWPTEDLVHLREVLLS